MYAELQRGAMMAANRYGGPVGLAGKLIGFGQAEIEAGVPKWSWFALGMISGGVVVYALRGRIERVVGG